MNCKPGDLAVIVRSPFRKDLIGLFVDVLCPAPNSVEFRLPDGKRHAPIAQGQHYWVCRFQRPVAAPHLTFGVVKTLYAPVPDMCLRPIRDQPGKDEMLRIVGLPREQEPVSLEA